MRLRLIVLASVFLAFPAHAETFLGVEGADSASDTEPPPSSAPAASTTTARKEARRPVSVPGDGDVSFSGGLGAGSNFVRGQATVGYSFNRYLGADVTGFYLQHDLGDTEGEEWGPQIDFVARGPNPTLVTPFVGAGPGYVKWQRRFEGELYDDGQGLTASAFAGLNIRLAPHFGIQAVRRQTHIFAEAPRRLDDRDQREGQTTINNQIGFHVAF